MIKKCSKCGAETNCDGDLHCRTIFVDEIIRLLSSEELEKAKLLFVSSIFDREWKWVLLDKIGRESKAGRKMEILIRKEMQQKEEVMLREEREKMHREYLERLGIEYLGVDILPSINIHRVTHCYNCKKLLDNSIHIECRICHWIVCDCGACGCGV